MEHFVGEDENKTMLYALIDVSFFQVCFDNISFMFRNGSCCSMGCGWKVLSSESSKEPLVIFIKDVEISITGNLEHCKKLEQLFKAESRVVIIGSHNVCSKG